MKLSKIVNQAGKKLEWTLNYLVWYSTSAAVGNSISEYAKGGNYHEEFGIAWLNHIIVGIPVNLVSPYIVDSIKNTKHPKTYTFIYTTTVLGLFTTWHYFSGTGNPIEASVLHSLAAYYRNQAQVRENTDDDKKENLDEKVL